MQQGSGTRLHNRIDRLQQRARWQGRIYVCRFIFLVCLYFPSLLFKRLSYLLASTGRRDEHPSVLEMGLALRPRPRSPVPASRPRSNGDSFAASFWLARMRNVLPPSKVLRAAAMTAKDRRTLAASLRHGGGGEGNGCRLPRHAGSWCVHSLAKCVFKWQGAGMSWLENESCPVSSYLLKKFLPRHHFRVVARSLCGRIGNCLQ